MLNQDYIDEFLEYLKLEKNYSDYTILKYQTNLEYFSKFLDYKSKKIDSLKLIDLKEFIHHLYNQKLDNSTISNYISTLKSFFKFLYFNKYISQNISKELSYPKKKQKLPKILYNNEVKMFINSIDTSKVYGTRNKALFLLLYSTGIRVSECSNLKLDNINFSEQIVSVLGKGNKERLVPINESVLEYLNIYIETERKNINKNNLDYLFINNKGGQLTSRGIRYLAEKISNTCNLNNISPHTFRHSLATSLLRAGMDLRFIQEILGHSNLSSTEIYTSLNEEEIKNQYLDKMRR